MTSDLKPRSQRKDYWGPCPNCDYSLLEDEPFCPSCGAQRDWGEVVK